MPMCFCIRLFAVELDQALSIVEFFERMKEIKIEEVKPLEEYQGPDTFSCEVAKKAGILQVVCDAIEQECRWKQDDKQFFYATMMKGGTMPSD
jgi:hypothetical protein